MADTPHHLAGGNAKTPPRLSPAEEIDWSQHCVVRLDEYQDMCDEIKRLRAQIDELVAADFEGVWDDTLIPIAAVLGVPLNDEHGVPRRQSQMVEAIIRSIRALEDEAILHR